MLKCLFTLVLLAGCLTPARAQSTNPPAAVRYHFGDNPAWADPNFKDSAWPLAPNGVWPAPPVPSSGFVWVRIHLPGVHDPQGPLALREIDFENAPPLDEIYLDGRLLGRNGQLPPHLRNWMAPGHLVFPVPQSPGKPDLFKVVAVRVWVSPAQREGASYSTAFTLDRAPVQEALARDSRDVVLFHLLPALVLGGLLALAGAGLIALGLLTHRRELLLFAIVLITGPIQSGLYMLQSGNLLVIPAWTYALVMGLLLAGVPISYSQFLWEALGLNGRGWKYACWAASVASALLLVYDTLATRPDRLFLLIHQGDIVTGSLRDAIELGAAVWAIVTRRSGRLLAFSILLTPLTSLSGYFTGSKWLVFIGNLFEPAVLLGGVLIAGILVWRAWRVWRSGERLQAELSAAREVQQRLVPRALPHIAGYEIASVYLPASEVGGDFYQVIDAANDSTLLVIGDVSGKGLKAAMNGTLALGALRALASEGLSPSALLARMNGEVTHAQDGGFITCLCARISRAGKVAFANAGHLSPYCNGEEIKLNSGLPLGIAPDAEYSETTLQLHPADTLTFLSDGVLEARNAAGELFGFERTRAISTQSAEHIANAAQQFGQDDDITVLTLQFAPVNAAPEVVRA